MKKISTLLLSATLSVTSISQGQIQLNKIGGYETGVFDEGAAEIISYNASNQYLYSVNSNDVSVDIISLVDPTNPSKVNSVDISAYGSSANSVAVGSDYFVVAVEHPDSAQLNGTLEFFNLSGTHIVSLTSGALPDNVQISADGNYVVAANEGEPSDAYDHDPEGTVSIVNMSAGVNSITQTDLTIIDFNTYNGTSISGAIVNHNPGNSTVAQDLEPEYVAFNSTSTKAYIVCQENNAMITVDLATASLDTIIGLGFKDWSATDGFDASNKSEAVNFKNWNVFGVYQPDAMVGHNISGVEYIFTANEGDGRDYDGFEGENRVKDLNLNTSIFSMTDITNDTLLGRLKVHDGLGLNPATLEYDSLYAYGARSFSIWNANDISLVYDSESIIEKKVFENDPINFNSTNDETDFKDRSDDKGPEPEAIAVGMVGSNYYAFVGLERHGGVMAFDVTDVNNVKYVDFINNRDFTADPTTSAAGDLAPECILFVPKAETSYSKDILIVANEVSGSISVYEINDLLTSSNKVSVNSFFVYPNPANDFIRTSLIDNYNLYDITGQQVKSVYHTNKIDISDLASGIYTIKNSTEALSFIVK